MVVGVGSIAAQDPIGRVGGQLTADMGRKDEGALAELYLREVDGPAEGCTVNSGRMCLSVIYLNDLKSFRVEDGCDGLPGIAF